MPSTIQQSMDKANKADDTCPVCKSSKYLNPRMEFMINPECYHKMCESCVDRIFSQGPAPCPVAGCGRTLRKIKFKKPTFADLKIERECDVRRRIAEVFNRREDEFEDLRAYNDYLEFVEDVSYNLIEGKDVAATEAKMQAYKKENAPSIAKNASLASQERMTLEEREASQREHARISREAARKEVEDERLEREAEKNEIVQRIAEGDGDPEEIARQGQKVILKKSTARRTATEKAKQQQIHDVAQSIGKDISGIGSRESKSKSGFAIRGLKAIKVAEPERPYDPFGGMNQPKEYFVLQNYYEYPWLDNARTDPQIIAGGYDVREYYSRTMLEATAGLGVFIADEVSRKDASVEKMAGTAGAAEVAG